MENDMNEELIQQQMQETRAALTEKLETLEQKVVGTVESATTTVSETVDAIKETVRDTVATVQEGVKGGVDSVKDLFDVPTHVRRRPWLAMGGAVAIGYCLGALTKRSAPQNMATATSDANRGAIPQFPTAPVPPTPASPAPSIWASEVDKVKGLALGMLFGTARELLVSSMPEHLGEQVKEIVDSVTKKVGGEPLPSSDWAKLCEPTLAQGEQANAPQSVPAPQLQRGAGNGHSAARRW